MKRAPKPPHAWTLVFFGGSLESDTGVWNPDCPVDWAHTANGKTERWVLRERDDENRVALMELVTDES